MSLIATNITGHHDFAAAYVGSPLQPANGPIVRKETKSCPLAALKGNAVADDSKTLTVEVAAGVPYLYGAAADSAGIFPQGATITLIDPSGKRYDESATTDDLLVKMDGESVHIFFIANPISGTWTLTTENLPASDVHVYMATLPTENVYETMVNAIRDHFNHDLVDSSDNSTACWLCVMSCWVIGLALLALIAAGTFFITATAGPVVSLGAWLGLSAASNPYVCAAILALVAVVGGAIAIVLDHLCEWAGACVEAGDAPITASMGQLTDGQTVSGTTKFRIDTTGDVDKVVVLLDAGTLGSDSGSTPYRVACDTTQYPNGSHLVGGIAHGRNGTTQIALPVSVTFSN